MRFLRTLGEGSAKRASLYLHDGKELVVFTSAPGKKRRLLWQARKESNIARHLPPLCCDIGAVHVKLTKKGYFISSNFIKGEPLTYNLFHSLTPSQQNLITSQYAEFLLALHTLPISRMDENFADEVSMDVTPPDFILTSLYSIY